MWKVISKQESLKIEDKRKKPCKYVNKNSCSLSKCYITRMYLTKEPCGVYEFEVNAREHINSNQLNSTNKWLWIYLSVFTF